MQWYRSSCQCTISKIPRFSICKSNFGCWVAVQNLQIHSLSCSKVNRWHIIDGAHIWEWENYAKVVNQEFQNPLHTHVRQLLIRYGYFSTSHRTIGKRIFAKTGWKWWVHFFFSSKKLAWIVDTKETKNQLQIVMWVYNSDISHPCRSGNYHERISWHAIISPILLIKHTSLHFGSPPW